jgi:hypothetical protein
MLVEKAKILFVSCILNTPCNFEKVNKVYIFFGYILEQTIERNKYLSFLAMRTKD